MNKRIPLSLMINEKVQRQILFFFPNFIFDMIIVKKYSNKEMIKLLNEHSKNYSLQYYPNTPEKVYKENPKEILLLKEEIFLPIYSLFGSGTDMGVDSFYQLNNNMNNPFYVNDFSFTVTPLNMNMVVFGGIYYYVEPEEYYSYLKTFRLPNDTIKQNYIRDYMPNLSSILRKNSIDFTDFEYYIFHRNTAVFDNKNIKRRKLNLSGIDNKYINFFKHNYYYNFIKGMHPNENYYMFGLSESFKYTKSTLKFVIKKIRFFFIQKHITFTIFVLNNMDQYDIENIKESDYLETEKKIISSYSLNGITIQEFYNNNNNNTDIEPILTFTSSQDMDYFEYPLNHFRFGKFILISYRKEKDNDALPKIFSYGSIVDCPLNF